MHELDALLPLLSEKQLHRCAKEFSQKLQDAVAGRQSCFPAILNPVSRKKPNPGYGVAISIGGTNGYVSAFRILPSGVVKFLNRIVFVLPQKTTKEKLFHLITSHVFRAVENRRKPFPIGIGFAYPLSPVLHHGFVDGTLIEMSKGRTVDGLVGKRVGQQYHRFLIEEYEIDTTVAVANDAICLLLGGNGADIAGIVGTGINFAYWEKCNRVGRSKMKALQDFSEPFVAVNIESAEFDGIPATALRAVVDEKSDCPTGALAEKEAAGAYLFQLFNAGKNELIGKKFPVLTATDQLNDMLTHAYVYQKNAPEKEKMQARALAERIFQRSAQIVAIQLCGILMTLGKTSGMVPIVMEGGIFWKAKNYHALVNLYAATILPRVIISSARLFGSSRRGIAMLAYS